ncbi:MAG: NAD(P)H-binding protein [Burkholderiaceae bacterium]|nr:NAD(P)H-binding protein [Burkholderiaceae bacterium]
MNLTLIGATGFVGAPLLSELLSRGHTVTVLARDPAKLPARDGLRVVTGDALKPADVATAARGADAVVSAFNPGWEHQQLAETFALGSRAILAGVRAAGVARVLVVGGAGSLFVAPGVQLVDTPAFVDQVPPNVVPGARAARDLLTEMRGITDLDWVFLSPPAMLAPGERSGRYQVGGEELMMAGTAPAGISVADLAVAIADELERPAHHRQRFTVAAA